MKYIVKNEIIERKKLKNEKNGKNVNNWKTILINKNNKKLNYMFFTN